MNYHSLDSYRLKKRYLIVKYLDSYLSTFNNQIITVSNCVMDFTLKNQRISKNKFLTIYNPVDLALFKPHNKITPKYLTIGFLGSLRKLKDLPTLINAVAIINKTNSNLQFIIAGEGPEKKFILTMIKKLNLEKTISLIGYVNDVNKEFFSKIDIFVLSSIIEGHPVALLEAMASGLPCVATDAGGIPETIINGESGYVVKKSNPLQLATKILEIANTPKLQENMGKKGREIVKNRFDIKLIANKHHRLYKSLIKQ